MICNCTSYVLRRSKRPRRYVLALDELGNAELTPHLVEAWVASASGSGSEGQDDLERLYGGGSEVVEEILARYERVELPPCG